eukprot:ctg_2431.g568
MLRLPHAVYAHARARPDETVHRAYERRAESCNLVGALSDHRRRQGACHRRHSPIPQRRRGAKTGAHIAHAQRPMHRAHLREVQQVHWAAVTDGLAKVHQPWIAPRPAPLLGVLHDAQRRLCQQQQGGAENGRAGAAGASGKVREIHPRVGLGAGVALAQLLHAFGGHQIAQAGECAGGHACHHPGRLGAVEERLASVRSVLQVVAHVLVAYASAHASVEQARGERPAISLERAGGVQHQVVRLDALGELIGRPGHVDGHESVGDRLQPGTEAAANASQGVVPVGSVTAADVHAHLHGSLHTGAHQVHRGRSAHAPGATDDEHPRRGLHVHAGTR